MKKLGIIIATVALVVVGALAFASPKNEPANEPKNKPVPTNDYKDMWKKVKDNLEKNLPESAEKELNAIEEKASKDKNQVQLLKTYLYRQQIFQFTVEEDPAQHFIQYAEGKIGQLDEVCNALLHEEIAGVYANYLSNNEWRINENLAIDGDISKVEMKYWDKESFKTRINQHYAEALKPVEALKKAKTEDFMVLYENKDNNEKYIEYETSLFEFMFHRVANYYQEQANLDDVEAGWDTESWWLPAANFVKVDLGTEDNPLIKCLKIFQDLIVYNLKQKNEDVLIYNDFKRFGFVNSLLQKDEQYQTAMEDLKAQHADNPLSAEITALIARSMIDQYESHSEDSTYFDRLPKAKALCEQAIAKFPKSQGAKNCESLIKRIEEPQINIELNQVQLPNEAIPAVLEYKNVTTPYFKIVKVSEKELEKFSHSYREDILKELNKKPAVAEQELALPAETDYRTHSSLIALPALERGCYYLIGTLEKGKEKEDKTLVISFQVSNLSYINDKYDNQMTVVTLDRKTGKTVEGVTVEFCRHEYDYKSRDYKTIVLKSVKSDKNGKAIMDGKEGDRSSFHVNLRKGDDVLLSSTNYYIGTPPDRNDRVYYSTSLFTDRAIYRPGQTVYFQGIVKRYQGKNQTLVNGYSEKATFKDANWQEIGSAGFTTDEYGTFSGSFVIPTDRLNGVFHLISNHGSTTIRVEEYKRPTFEVTFERPKEQYKLNQEVTVRGDVKAYAGFGLDDVEYSYRVIRKTSFPWRCWWWWYPTVEDEQITYGKARTDENGKFAVTFNLKPSKTIAPEKQPVFTYEIEVTATSKQGETHADTYSLRAGYNEIAISTDLPSEFEKSEIGKYQISVSNLSWQPAKSRVSRKIYRYENAEKINYFEAMGHSVKLDRQILSDAELARLFPEFNFYESPVVEPVETPALRQAQGPQKSLVCVDEIMVDDKAKFYDGKALGPGKYVVELTSLDDPLAKISQQFTVYENDSKMLPFTTMEWVHQNLSTAKPGDEIQLSLGSSAKDVDIWVQLLHGDEIRLDKKITVSNSVQTLSYKVTEQDRGGLSWRYAFVKENSLNADRLSVSVPFDNYDLNVKLATMRDKLSPGAEETWEVTVRDYKDKPLEAGLLAGMYDASLDEFARNHWWFNMSPSGVSGRSFNTDGHGFTSSNTGLDYFYFVELFNFSLPSDAPFFDFGFGYSVRNKKAGRGRHTEDVYMCVEEAAVPNLGATMNKQTFVANSVAELEEAEYSAADMETGGSAEAKKDEPKEPAEPTLRENFNETAFFFPQMRTNADGSATFSFTMPDALTRWRLMLLAYSKDRKTGSNEYTFTSSKPVMIMADMPRYMYDNDELWFVANVINTGDEAVTPKAKLEIFDAATMEPVNLIVTDGPSTLRQAQGPQGSGTSTIPMEQIMPGRSKEVRWKVKAQYDLELLAFRFTAYAGEFSDAEQHLLPVLSSEIFMTQTLPITVKAETEQTFDFEAIANPDSHERDYSLTLNFSTNPVWYAVQALPYLANISTDRAETAFYVFYANTLSSYIADNIPNLLAYIKKWQIETPDALLSQLEKDQDLKAIMLQETPWVLEAKSETEQRNRIATLFEVNTMRGQQTRALQLIEQKQKYNGGWAWMDGMPESAYITTYILSGFGKLQKMGAWSSLSQADQNTAQSICDKAVRYLEYDVAETYRYMKRHSKGKDWPIGSSTLNELYTLSFFKEQNSDKDFATAKKYYLKSLDETWTSFNFNQRSKGALVLYRTGNEKTAKLMIQSFKECAQKNEQIGMYWPKKYFSYESHIATHANIMAAFAEIDQDEEMIDQLRVWLLTQKQTNSWENSASTADAIYALLMRGSDWFAEGKEVTLRFGNTPISTEGGVAGTGFIQRRWNANEVTTDMRQLTVNNPTNHLVWGGLFRQYFVPIDEVKSDESGFTIKRELFVETVTDKGKKLVPVEKQALKVGDKLTVKITFTSQQDMSFVFVKDLRAAGFEPIEQISRYEYNDRMSYYQSNTDTDMEFFIERLPKGTHQLEYSMFVTKEGHLNNGYALIQCQYAPEFSAYSDGMKVKVGK